MLGSCAAVGVIIAAVVTPLVAAVAAAAAAGFLCGAAAGGGSAQERAVRARADLLRRELGLTRAHGYVLDSDWAAGGPGAGRWTVLRRAELEAAARLAMLWWDGADPRLVHAAFV